MQRIVSELKIDLTSEIQKAVNAEMKKLEASAAGSMSTPTSSPSSTQTDPPAPASSPATERAKSEQDGVVVSQGTGGNIYCLIETTEDLIALGKAGKARAFDQKAEHAEELITLLDNELLSQVDLTAE